MLFQEKQEILKYTYIANTVTVNCQDGVIREGLLVDTAQGSTQLCRPVICVYYVPSPGVIVIH
jgi:hypothetical protein